MRTKLVLLASLLACPLTLPAASATLLGWNNLGMHCMDSDYSVFTVLPPYNTIEAQLIVAGKLVTNGTGYTVTYQALADPSGSINTTAIGKGNFYAQTPYLYGPVAPDAGLAGWSMPGPANIPQTNVFETLNQPAQGIFTPVNWFRAEGIPITPYDDMLQKNPYPLMRMIARNSAYQPIATNDVVLPVSDEMDCRACHASGTQQAAKPAAGWIWDGLPERDYRLNILRLHDERQFAQHADVYAGALAANNYNPAGLYRRVTIDRQPVLCALCHASEALGTSGYPGVQPLTASVHATHAQVMDPVLNITLDNSLNRAACYRCHPGSTTRCLRGAMGSAIAPDGSMEMQCQSCHGNMSLVGTPFPARIGWFMEPNCQACHTGTATSNSGQIRFASAFDSPGHLRDPANKLFATTPNTPPSPYNLSLYRFSIGHGGLQCSACHGSTHAEFPSSHNNDNLRNTALQGHAGVMIECTACHTAMPNTANGGPHGMHAIGAGWVNGSGGVTKHADRISSVGLAYCQSCHGLDYRGTPLSRAQANRTLTASFDGTLVTLNLFRGAEVGCYDCHNGPFSSSPSTAVAPVAINVSTNTTNDKLVPITLGAAGPAWRIVAQPAHGSIGLTNNTAAYFPEPGFVGTDTFTFAAYNGAKNSLLATGTVVVTQGAFTVDAAACVPPSYPAQWPVPFNVVPKIANHAAPPAFAWTFGDGAQSTGQMPVHTYTLPGVYPWSVRTTVDGQSVVRSGSITIGQPMRLTATRQGSVLKVTWPASIVDAVLEGSPSLAPGASWHWMTNPPTTGLGQMSLTVPADQALFLRLNRPW